jgi:CRP/FNR family transcriptional regulator
MGTLLVANDLNTELDRMATTLAKPVGTVLFRRGDQPSGIFLIHDGKVRLTLDDKARLYPPKVLGSGSIVGLPATLSGSPYSLTAEVVDDAEVGFIPRQILMNYLRANPAACFELMQTLSEEISDMRAAIKNTGTRTQ